MVKIRAEEILKPAVPTGRDGDFNISITQILGKRLILQSSLKERLFYGYLIIMLHKAAANSNIITQKIKRLFQRETTFDVIHSAVHHRNKIQSDHFITLTIAIETIDPLAALEILGSANEFRYYWEIPDRGHAIAGGGAVETLKSTGPDRFQDMAKKIEDVKEKLHEITETKHSMAGLHFLGGFSFSDFNSGKHWRSFGSASFTIPEWMVVKDGKLCLLTLTKKIEKSHTPGKLTEQLSETATHIARKLSEYDESILKPELLKSGSNAYSIQPNNNAYKNWISGINQAKELMQDGIFEKIVLARELKLKTNHPVSATRALNKLRNSYPGCYSFLIQHGKEGVFLGSTPERLVSFNAHYLLTEGLAGSISRGDTATEDAVLEKKLLNSSKNLREHQYVVSAIRQRLEAFAGKLQNVPRPVVKKLSNVQHLYTPIRAQLNQNLNPCLIVEKMHPTPAVGGFPTDKALPYIPQLEQFDRGWYAGPVGWLNNRGDGEFSVAIRSGLISDNTVRFFAGCGIVSDSDPESEWEETKLKFIPMLSAL